MADDIIRVGSIAFNDRMPPDPAQRADDMKIRGANARDRDAIVEQQFDALREASIQAAEPPPDNYQPMSDAAKAQVTEFMAKYMKEYELDHYLAECREPPAGVPVHAWKQARDRKVTRDRGDVSVPVFRFWPEYGQYCPMTFPVGMVNAAELFSVPADCSDLPGLLARVRWSRGRPVKWA